MRYGSMLPFVAGLSFTLALHLTACAQTSAQKPMHQTTTPRDNEGYWTPERMRKARPMPMPSIPDERPPRGSDDQVREYQPPSDEDYWTPERMRKARPMPMPSIPDGRNPRIPN